LPVSRDYYQAQGLELIVRGEWRSALCPFHPDRSPSLRVGVVLGGFGATTAAMGWLTTCGGMVSASLRRALNAWEEEKVSE
jgi:hypothetical protein